MSQNQVYRSPNSYAQSESPEEKESHRVKVLGDSQKPGWRNTLSTILIIGAAPVIAVLLVLYVFQSYQVDGPSMSPTLMNSDRLIVWKLPKTWSRITGHSYIPKRGDIVIFKEPKLGGKQLIKRVIGLPGDRVVIDQSNEVTIYNSAYPNGFHPDTSLPYGTSTKIPPTIGDENLTINPGELFVCGDNRPDSLDSRYFGVVTNDEIVGKLVLRILPLNQAERF